MDSSAAFGGAAVPMQNLWLQFCLVSRMLRLSDWTICQASHTDPVCVLSSPARADLVGTLGELTGEARLPSGACIYQPDGLCIG